MSRIGVGNRWEAPPVSAPGVPQNVAATGGAQQVSLTWDALPGRPRVRNYNVKRSLSSGTEVLIATSTIPSYLDTGLDDATEYFYKISSQNKTGESADSDESSATTDAGGGGGNGLRVDLAEHYKLDEAAGNPRFPQIGDSTNNLTEIVVDAEGVASEAGKIINAAKFIGADPPTNNLGPALITTGAPSFTLGGQTWEVGCWVYLRDDRAVYDGPFIWNQGFNNPGPSLDISDVSNNPNGWSSTRRLQLELYEAGWSYFVIPCLSLDPFPVQEWCYVMASFDVSDGSCAVRVYRASNDTWYTNTQIYSYDFVNAPVPVSSVNPAVPIDQFGVGGIVSGTSVLGGVENADLDELSVWTGSLRSSGQRDDLANGGDGLPFDDFDNG